MKVIIIALLLTEGEVKSLIERNFSKEYEQYENGDKSFIDRYFGEEYKRLKKFNSGSRYELFEKYYCEPSLFSFLELFEFPASEGDNTFKIMCVSRDYVRGMRFRSFAAPDAESAVTEPEIYVVMADRQFCEKGAVTDGVYKNLAELCDEMKDKLDKYMPKNFKWYAHLGVLSGEPSF